MYLHAVREETFVALFKRNEFDAFKKDESEIVLN